MSTGTAQGRRLIGVMILVLAPACQPSGRPPDESPTTTPPPAVSDSAAIQSDVSSAMDVVRAYYRAIDERRYADAYRLWGSNGAASRQTFDAFRAGFSETEAVEVTFGTPGPIEGAAGSRYVDLPVQISARLRSGATQEFTGTYTLRRAVVDGATPEQRAWHFDSARLRQTK